MRKFATKIALPQNSVNQYFGIQISICIFCKLYELLAHLMFLSYFYYWECILGVLFGAPGFCLAYLVFCLAYLIFVCCTWYFVWRTWCYLFLTWWFAWHTINSWHTWCVVWCNWYFFGVLHHNFFADLCLYSLNKLWWKQSLSRSLWKKVRRLEKGTPPPVVAVVTNMSYDHKTCFITR